MPVHSAAGMQPCTCGAHRAPAASSRRWQPAVADAGPDRSHTLGNSGVGASHSCSGAQEYGCPTHTPLSQMWPYVQDCDARLSQSCCAVMLHLESLGTCVHASLSTTTSHRRHG